MSGFNVGDKVRIKPEGWVGTVRRLETIEDQMRAVVYVVASDNGPDVRMTAAIHGVALKDLELV